MFKKAVKSFTGGIYQKWLRVINHMANNKEKEKEKKILLQMGFSEKQAEQLIAYALHYRLLQAGLGQLIWRTAKLQQINPKEAGKRLSEGLYWYEWQIKIAAERRIK